MVRTVYFIPNTDEWALLLTTWPPAGMTPALFPATRLVDGIQVAGHEFSEFSTPFFTMAPGDSDLVAAASHLAWDLKLAFQGTYSHSPLHPDRVAGTPGFTRDTRRLQAQLACAHAVYLISAGLRCRAREAVAEATAAREAEVLTAREAEEHFLAAFLPLSTHGYLSAWLDVPAEALAYVGTYPGYLPVCTQDTQDVEDSDNDNASTITTTATLSDNEEMGDAGWGTGDAGWGTGDAGWGTGGGGWGTGDVSGQWDSDWLPPRFWKSQSRHGLRGRRSMGRTFRGPCTSRRRPAPRKLTPLESARYIASS
ncbi:hypothetical protein B0H15DRAFT_957800 [Mycena belliarum]|uniref:Uncharacterized protein n=1 Tax=Mycena belliarum TaxID=1033014 RepID=A0AAD6TLS2_9AGAR|nr:hypothetical protein B0H15DRAFT_957800 [Mycena belliae]